MGENLVRNIVSYDESIVVWNRTLDKVDALSTEIGSAVQKASSIAELVSRVESPRNIILLVPAGKVTDEVAHELFELLSPEDAIWDLGNAHWDTTIAHQTEALKHGIHWIGCGISGGSEGARLGPSLMPGGEETSVKRMLPLLEKIAAKDFTGKPCVTYVGKAAAGNFVKMVHNGIEYALMQGIAEIYDILRSANMSQSDIQNVFRELNTGLTKSFLLDITVDILGTKDTDGADLLTKISDIAGSKGTG
jgi:6-phosphogluconate dehydrogenase